MVTARSAGRVRREPHGLASSIRERAPDPLNGTEPVAAQPPGAEDDLGGEDEEFSAVDNWFARKDAAESARQLAEFYTSRGRVREASNPELDGESR
jgi:hypothetical protein